VATPALFAARALRQRRQAGPAGCRLRCASGPLPGALARVLRGLLANVVAMLISS
jgi:hypothetical protein